MPGRDGTGPMGQGRMTGGRAGNCCGASRPMHRDGSCGAAHGMRRGCNQRLDFGTDCEKNPDSKERMLQSKTALEAKLAAINRVLDRE